MNYPIDKKGRYMRIPIPLKSKHKPINLIAKHKSFISWYQRKLGLSDYGLLWLVFFKGMFLALIVERLIRH